MNTTVKTPIRLVNVKCPNCTKGVITKVPRGTDMRKLIFYTGADEITKARWIQVHKCPKCGDFIGLRMET